VGKREKGPKKRGGILGPTYKGRGKRQGGEKEKNYKQTLRAENLPQVGTGEESSGKGKGEHLPFTFLRPICQMDGGGGKVRGRRLSFSCSIGRGKKKNHGRKRRLISVSFNFSSFFGRKSVRGEEGGRVGRCLRFRSFLLLCHRMRGVGGGGKGMGGEGMACVSPLSSGRLPWPS